MKKLMSAFSEKKMGLILFPKIQSFQRNRGVFSLEIREKGSFFKSENVDMSSLS